MAKNSHQNPYEDVSPYFPYNINVYLCIIHVCLILSFPQRTGKI